MTRIVLSVLILITACEGYDMPDKTFWDHFRADQLGSTHRVLAGPDLGNNGEPTREKLIDISAADKYATPMIISLRTEYRVDQATVSQNPGPGGTLVGPVPGTGVPAVGFPLVGRIEWGVGGARNVVDFDLAQLRAISGSAVPQSNLATPDPGNGVQVYIGGASAVHVSVRHDGNLMPLSSIVAPNVMARIGNINPAWVKAFVGPASAGRGGSPLRRSIYIAGGTFPAVQPLPPASPVQFDIPAFARRVRFPRIPIDTTPLQIIIIDGTFGTTVRNIILPANSDGPIEINNAHEALINVTNLGAVNITGMQAVFDVDPI